MSKTDYYDKQFEIVDSSGTDREFVILHRTLFASEVHPFGRNIYTALLWMTSNLEDFNSEDVLYLTGLNWEQFEIGMNNLQELKLVEVVKSPNNPDTYNIHGCLGNREFMDLVGETQSRQMEVVSSV